MTTPCLGCNRLEIPEEHRTLHDGRIVCSYCPAYAQECLARELLKMPLKQRRERLGLFSEKMATHALESLKDRLKSLHAARKK
jgi:hypothetical protein